MLGVGGRGVVLEGLVVGDVVADVAPDDLGAVIATAAGRAVGIGEVEVEAALEPTPTDAGGAQQVADVASAHGEGGAGGARARIADGIGIGDVGQRAGAAINDAALPVHGLADAVGLARGQIQRTHGRGAEGAAEGTVGHGKVLGIVPQRGDRIAIKVAHGQAFGCGRGLLARRRALAPGVLGKEVHFAAVEGLLLGAVGVALVGGVGLRAIEAERVRSIGAIGDVGEVGVFGEELALQAIHLGGMRQGSEWRFAGRVERLGVGGEVVI